MVDEPAQLIGESRWVDQVCEVAGIVPLFELDVGQTVKPLALARGRPGLPNTANHGTSIRDSCSSVYRCSETGSG